MTNIFIYLIFIFTGLITGSLSGLLGIGGGLIIVPILAYTFKLLNLPEQFLMHYAIGTSLSIILVNVSSSTYFHNKKKRIDWNLYSKMAIFTAIGSTVGAFIAYKIDKESLKMVFATYVTLVALKMLFFSNKDHQSAKVTPTSTYSIVGLIIGTKSSILGIGGGTISIPFLTWRGHSMIDAVGISAALGIPISIFGSASYLYNGLKTGIEVDMAIGFIYFPALFGCMITIPFASRLGASYAHKIDQRKLKKFFGILLMIIAIRTFIKNLN